MLSCHQLKGQTVVLCDVRKVRKKTKGEVCENVRQSYFFISQARNTHRKTTVIKMAEYAHPIPQLQRPSTYILQMSSLGFKMRNTKETEAPDHPKST